MYDEVYRTRLGGDYSYSTHNIQCFDGVWAFALALNQTINGKIKTLFGCNWLKHSYTLHIAQ